MPRELSQFERYLVHEFVEDYVDGIMSRRDMMAGCCISSGVWRQPQRSSRSWGSRRPPPRRVPRRRDRPRRGRAAPRAWPRMTRASPPQTSRTRVSTTRRSPPTRQCPPRVMRLFPVVLICHANRGLTEHIRDVTRRWAAQGYLAAAVDLLNRKGGTAAIADPAEVPALLSDDTKLQRHVDDFKAAAAH